MSRHGSADLPLSIFQEVESPRPRLRRARATGQFLLKFRSRKKFRDFVGVRNVAGIAAFASMVFSRLACGFAQVRNWNKSIIEGLPRLAAIARDDAQLANRVRFGLRRRERFMISIWCLTASVLTVIAPKGDYAKALHALHSN